MTKVGQVNERLDGAFQENDANLIKQKAHGYGIRIPQTIFWTAMDIVLRNNGQVSGSLNMKRKFFRPTHCWSPNSPLTGM
jgi:hypothetical protein